MFMLNNDELIKQIQEVLEQLRPYFLMHGGNIDFVKFEQGNVYVQLFGACAGCDASSYTLKLLVEDTLKKEVPQVQFVIEI